MWKPEFISIIFPIIPVISECPLQAGAPGSCTAGPPFSPVLNTRTLDRCKYTRQQHQTQRKWTYFLSVWTKRGSS